MNPPQYGLLTIVVAIALVAGVSDALEPKKIVGGQRAEIGEFPYQVSVREYGRHQCGGAIVDQRHVLTAAQCVKYLSHPWDDAVVVTGSVDVDSGQVHEIKSITYDDRYNESLPGSPYDIALIALKKNIIFNDNQRSVALPDGPTPSGVSATEAGWGTTVPATRIPSAYLRKFNTRILSHEECLAATEDEDKDKILEGFHICALNRGGIDSCNGDSGGGLVYDGHLIGIDSFGNVCGKGFASGYTNVFHLLSWIREKIAETYSSEGPSDVL